MKLTRQQRINNIGSSIVNDLTNLATNCRKLLTEGVDIEPQQGYPALKATGEEIREALGDNAKEVETVLEFVLGGKSNRIVKGGKSVK